MTTAYRDADLSAENERLRKRVAELEARPKRKAKAWTNEQRASVGEALGVGSMILGIVSGIGACVLFVNRHPVAGGVCAAITALLGHTLLAAWSEHWDWWRGIGGGDE